MLKRYAGRHLDGLCSANSLQEELKKRGLDSKWTPLKGKKELVDRLQVQTSFTKVRGCCTQLWGFKSLDPS